MEWDMKYELDGRAKGLFSLIDSGGQPVMLERVDLANRKARSELVGRLSVKTGLLPSEIDRRLLFLAAEAEARRSEAKQGAAPPLQGQELRVEWPPAWPNYVPLADILAEAVDLIGQAVICTPEQRTAGALWAAWTYVIDHFDIAPILAVTAPTKRCGKTTYGQVIGSMAARPLWASNISPSAIFRSMEAARPTLLIDEGDTFLAGNEELRGILNSGHTKETAFVIRCTGEDLQPRRFSTWGAKLLILIGSLPSTLADRSIEIRLTRKSPSEKTLPVREAVRRGKEIARKLFTWMQGLPKQVPTVEADGLPLHDRSRDNWRPLLSIAALAGDPWPRLAEEAALALAQETEKAEDPIESFLADCLEVFGSETCLTASELAERLAGLPESPWPTWNRGRPIDPRQVGRFLRRFGIQGQKTMKGKLYFQNEILPIAQKFSFSNPENFRHKRHGEPKSNIQKDLEHDVSYDVYDENDENDVSPPLKDNKTSLTQTLIYQDLTTDHDVYDENDVSQEEKKEKFSSEDALWL